MGSFQQICLGTICLAAAFFFGNYVNNNPPLETAAGTPVAGFSQFGSTANRVIDGGNDLANSGRIRSQLPLPDFSAVENKPAPIMTMKTPLKSRFAVPTIQAAPTDIASPAAPQYSNPLPPPSQLPVPKRIDQSNQHSPELFSANPFSTNQFSEPPAVAPTVQVPDFSAIAAEFKNTPIELPSMSRLGGMPSYSNTIQPEPDPLVNRQNINRQNTAPLNSQLKQLVRQLPDNGFRNPNFEQQQDPQRQLRQHVNAQQPFEANGQRDFELGSQPNTPQRGFTQADFEPNLNDNIFGLKPRENRFENTTQQNENRLQSVSNDASGYRYDNTPPPVPPQPQFSDDQANRARSDRSSSGFRGNLTFRPLPEHHSNQSDIEQIDQRPFASSEFRQPRERYRATLPRGSRPNFAPAPNNPNGLPFRLTEQAKTELVQLRDRADSMIGLESTNFVDHTIRNGETLQSISTRYFGSPDYYLDIYLANRNKLRNPADTPTGVSIRVPVYQAK